MKILIRQALINDANSAHHQQVKDILIEDGRITQISDQYNGQANQVVDAIGCQVSPGWVDPFALGCDPGMEHRETLATLAASAAAGGFTRCFALPDNQPVTDNKAQVEYIRLSSGQLPALIHPLGAITRKMEGLALAEMYDMYNSGAVAFTDGLKPVQSPGLFMKALQYVKAFDGVLIQIPIDKSIGAGGLMNESIVSTRLGLPGIPAIAEELMIKRDLDLLRYTGSRLHITAVSTAKSIALIQAAKAEGLQVTCSATPYHLFFTEEDMAQYDTNLKLNPPLRSAADVAALRAAVMDGTVDCIASHHLPQDWDHKTCEFEYAAPGMIGLQTVFQVLQSALPALSNERLIEILSTNTRNIFQLPATNIVEGAAAELTIFNRDKTTTLEKSGLKSRSANSPFLGKTMPGKIVATILNNQLTTQP